MSATDQTAGCPTGGEGAPGRKPAEGPIALGAPDPGRIAAELARLASEGRLFGAEVNPEVLKKSGKGVKFLAREAPPPQKALALWLRLFGDRVSPLAFLASLSPDVQGMRHRDAILLFAKDRIIYDSRIVRGEEDAGELTLFFQVETQRGSGWLGFLKSRRIKIVYIENITLRAQASGYASALFRHYEGLFACLGFNRFRLKASLSVGKYYWAKEGFDCLDESGVAKMREGLRALARQKRLPVRDAEIDRLNHAYDVALFRRDIRVPVFRDREGYYFLAPKEQGSEQFFFPLGKAYLLTADPWDGEKVIYTNTPRRTGLVFSTEYLEHRTRRGHVETPGRIEALWRALDREDLRDSLVLLKPYRPEAEEVTRVHDPAYLEEFRRAAAASKPIFATADCSISRKSYDVALLAAGGVMAGVDAVVNRRVENVFCAVRPPGHHAGRATAMGFCFVNNVAVGAAYARAAYGIERIFILDWDVHHGNGTQELFEEDPLTYFCSIHEHPTFCYPGTGRRMERGKGAGEGATLNLPLPPHAGDEALTVLFDREVVPEIDRFRPDLIMISAGFDGHRDDPIAHLDLTERSFVHMTRRICEAADRHCGGRVVSVLEGGYDRASFAASIVAHLKALQGRSG